MRYKTRFFSFFCKNSNSSYRYQHQHNQSGCIDYNLSVFNHLDCSNGQNPCSAFNAKLNGQMNSSLPLYWDVSGEENIKDNLCIPFNYDIIGYQG